MHSKKRKNVRFNDFGWIDCPELCAVNGVLDDISLDGCKIHYDAPVSINADDDYELHIRLSRLSSEPLILLCHPQWTNEDGGCTEIGFKILHSPDTSRLEGYINQLHAEKKSAEDEFIPSEESCQFV